MGAQKDTEADFISGIYNYCDRWCERCPLTDRCMVYYQETKKRKAHLAKGEDPDDWNIVFQDLHENFQETITMAKQMAEENGIDLSQEQLDKAAAYNERKRRKIARHPFRIKAHKWAMDCHRFLETLSTVIHEEERKGVPTEALSELQECFSVTSWYHMQIAVKVDRALDGVKRKKETAGPAPASYDAKGSAKVAYIGMSKVLDALTVVCERYQPLNVAIMPLLTVLCELMEELDRTIPGHRKFKRPGFDA